MSVFLAVEALVEAGGGPAHGGVVADGANVGGCHDRGHHGEVDAGGEERVNEAGGVSDEYPAVAYHAVGGVGPVLDDAGR